MALVDYSTSSSDEGSDSTTSKRKRSDEGLKAPTKKAKPNQEPLSLPAEFHNLYAFAPRTSTQDDPELHGGRMRSVPHIKGNWPSHVYLEWHPNAEQVDHLNIIISKVRAELKSASTSFSLHSLIESQLGVPQPLHVSLSAALNLSTEQREPFLQSIRARAGLLDCSEIPSLEKGSVRSKVREKDRQLDSPAFFSPFTLRIASLSWVPNESRTRWFLILRLSKPDNDELNRLLNICNDSAHEFGQDKLYKDSRTCSKQSGGGGDRAARQPKRDEHATRRPGPVSDATDNFHFSIAWTLQEPPFEGSAQKQLDEMEVQLPAVASSLEVLRGYDISVKTLKVKMGNEVTAISLNMKDYTEEDSWRRGIMGR